MKSRPRSLRWGALCITLCALLSSCDDDGSGTPPTLFFGTNNIEACDYFYVDVDLQAAGAVVARRPNGSVDCDVDPSLDALGCNVAFETINGDDVLQVTIDGCDVPAIANLFRCEFTQADLPGLRAATSAICSCAGEPLCDWNIYCDRTPGVCISASADPGACEDCFNDRDDDGNGFTDCDDQNCHVPDCGFGQTTVTCSSTTTTTTTSSTSTSLGFTGSPAQESGRR